MAHSSTSRQTLLPCPGPHGYTQVPLLLRPGPHARVRVPFLPCPGRHGCLRVPLLPRPGPHGCVRVPLLPRPGPHGCVRVPLLPRPGPRPGPHPVWLLKIYKGTRWEFGVVWHAGHCSKGHLSKGVLTIMLAAACSMVLLPKLSPKHGLKN